MGVHRYLSRRTFCYVRQSLEVATTRESEILEEKWHC